MSLLNLIILALLIGCGVKFSNDISKGERAPVSHFAEVCFDGVVYLENSRGGLAAKLRPGEYGVLVEQCL